MSDDVLIAQWDVIVHSMDDAAREAAHASHTSGDDADGRREFLSRYLAIVGGDLAVG